LFDLTSALGSRHLVNLTVGPALDPVVLSVAERLEHRPGALHRYRIHHLVDGTWREHDLRPMSNVYHGAQPLPDGRWFLACYRAGADQQNGHVYSSGGALLDSMAWKCTTPGGEVSPRRALGVFATTE
jgi:hypothetical protein